MNHYELHEPNRECQQLPTTEPLTQAEPYLGPATVKLAMGGKVLLLINGENCWASLAMAVMYQPVADDIVLAIRQTGDVFVIGVIMGNGNTVICSHGDLELNAPQGKIRVAAKNNIELSSGRIYILAQQLDIIAETLQERFDNARRIIVNTYSVKAANITTAVKHTFSLRSRRNLQRADEDVKIDGERIKLG